jgi:hypothetical protein
MCRPSCRAVTPTLLKQYLISPSYRLRLSRDKSYLSNPLSRSPVSSRTLLRHIPKASSALSKGEHISIGKSQTRSLVIEMPKDEKEKKIRATLVRERPLDPKKSAIENVLELTALEAIGPVSAIHEPFAR